MGLKGNDEEAIRSALGRSGQELFIYWSSTRTKILPPGNGPATLSDIDLTPQAAQAMYGWNGRGPLHVLDLPFRFGSNPGVTRVVHQMTAEGYFIEEKQRSCLTGNGKEVLSKQSDRWKSILSAANEECCISTFRLALQHHGASSGAAQAGSASSLW